MQREFMENAGFVYKLNTENRKGKQGRRRTEPGEQGFRIVGLRQTNIFADLAWDLLTNADGCDKILSCLYVRGFFRLP